MHDTVIVAKILDRNLWQTKGRQRPYAEDNGSGIVRTFCFDETQPIANGWLEKRMIYDPVIFSGGLRVLISTNTTKMV